MLASFIYKSQQNYSLEGSMSLPVIDQLKPNNEFAWRHCGPNPDEANTMLTELGFCSFEEMINKTIPKHIRTQKELNLPLALAEHEAISELHSIARKNKVFKSYIGMGYYNTVLPPVIQRNILENPGWYTQYTPYQAEISQGRLEALINFQTMISDLTGLEVANASMLDEGTSAAEAMSLAFGQNRNKAAVQFFVDENCHPQTIEVLQTRAEPIGVEIVIGDYKTAKLTDTFFGAIVSYPGTNGSIKDFSKFSDEVHSNKAFLVVVADILSLALLKPPGEFGADIAVGSTQRFGVPMGFGGPHAAYFATKEKFKRAVPGRIIGLSKDAEGHPAYRLALQTREQHIRRERATSNICTAQVLLAIMASMYAVYHGPNGIKKIAQRVHRLTVGLAKALDNAGLTVANKEYFDTIEIQAKADKVSLYYKQAEDHGLNLRKLSDTSLTLSLDETTTLRDVEDILHVFDVDAKDLEDTVNSANAAIPKALERQSPYLQHDVFKAYHSETEMLRYLQNLQKKDLSLTGSMIPLGSCTMKLNAAAEMLPITWPEFTQIHPFAPKAQTKGYLEMIDQLENWLSEITGFAKVTVQPNAGSQGEYAGLLVIHQYFKKNNQAHRNICLIPESAHGTNPASAVLAGMKVIGIKCDEQGNIDLTDLENKAKEHQDNLAALMVTYPSTHGVFEEGIKEICQIIHDNGGQVYMDGANMNAQIGYCRPGEYGPDVCHLNLHKTFAIPHGGGGPGVGPIGVKEHLVEFLPGHKTTDLGGPNSLGPVSAAAYGSPNVLPISWMYIRMMGTDGLKLATEMAILNANYIAKKVAPSFPVLYSGKEGLVAHECILDFRHLQNDVGITVEDVAKRLMDYGFHAPTMSWPVAGTLMVEPTESESKRELDRFIEAMQGIYEEVQEIVQGKASKENNVLVNSPHTASMMTAETWDRPYSREKALFPSQWTRNNKFWVPVARVDNAFGDRNLVCTCPSVSELEG
jgi:glycine dehydrogenase